GWMVDHFDQFVVLSHFFLADRLCFSSKLDIFSRYFMFRIPALSWTVVVHAFSLSTQEAYAGVSL
ncbi:hypothetical protein ACQP3C_31150, partial [Escherichia coli]